MAGWDEIRFIEPGPRPIRPLDSGARELTNADAVQRISFNPHPRYDGWTGANIRIGICDQGIDLTNREFARLDKGAVALGQFRIFGTEADWAGHGTHVASIAAGNGINSQGSGYPAYSLRGFAPEAELGAYPFLGDDPRLHFEAAVTGRSDVTNHSYEESEGHYDGVSFFIDEVVRGDGKSDHRPIPARPQVWSAGNNGDKPRTGVTVGYYAMLTQAKNSISVGAVDSIDGHLSAFSSLGPTLDGRIKPDLVAPGAYDSRACPVKGILAARANARPKEELYVENYGTSMAAPVVSAAIALMKERRLKAPDGRAELRPSTYKALLIHSARDCVHTRPYEDRSREFNNPDTGGPVLYHAGPDFATGFGLVDVRAACDLIADPDLWREGSFTGPGQGRTFRVSVAPGEAELKAVIAWDDATDTERKLPFASRLVNDLDLSLIAPDGAEHLPWVLDPPPLSSAYRLRLLRGLADEKDLPEKGKALVVVATVKGTIHFRIFDGLGGRRDLNAADLPEKAPEIRGLEGQLKDLWTVRVLPERTKDRIIWSVSSIVDPDRRIDLGFSDPAVIDPEDLKPAYRGRDHRNNAEMVTVPFPRPGEWEIRVRSHRLRGPEQPFSVVCSSPIAR